MNINFNKESIFRTELALGSLTLMEPKELIPIISNEFKSLFGLTFQDKVLEPSLPSAKVSGNDIPQNTVTSAKVPSAKGALAKITLSKYLKAVEEQGKVLSNFFIYEMMRLLAFRHLMCLKSNILNNIEVCLFDSSGPLVSASGTCAEASAPEDITISRLDFPISVNEKNFTYDKFDTSSRVPKTVVKIWFDNNDELLIRTVKDLLTDFGIKDEHELKDKLIQCIKKLTRYDGFLVYWVNAIVENSRYYFRMDEF